MAAPARLNLHRPAKARPHVLIVTPALAAANNGNSHTALRWQRMLAPVARVQVALAWQGEPVDALIVLHARRSAASVARWREARAGAPLALVLTGTTSGDLASRVRPHSTREPCGSASAIRVLRPSS